MKARQRRYLIMFVVLLSMTVLAAPARGSDWYSFHLSSLGFGLSVGSSDWWVHTRAWNSPYQTGSYDAVLTGYGEWVYVHGIGRAWRPHVAAGWRPYTHGRWVHATIGWTWVAYEPWGYFPHHYGTWAHTHVGWVWTPGYSYHPANVVWVRWAGYVGWYPCGPAGWSHAARGYHHGYRHGYDRGYGDGWHDAQHATYVPWNHLSSHDVSRHAVGGNAVRRSEPASRMRAGATAPTRSQMRQRRAEMIPEVELSRRTVQIGNRTMTVARPEGMASSVQRHARRTVDRALSPGAGRYAKPAQPTDAGTSPRPATAPTNRASESAERTRNTTSSSGSTPARTTSANRTVRDRANRTRRGQPSEASRVQTTTRSSRANPSVRRTPNNANRERRSSDSFQRSRPATTQPSISPSKPANRQPEARAPGTRSTTRAMKPEQRRTSTRPSQNARKKPADARTQTANDGDAG